MTNEPTYVLTENVANCLRALAYDLLRAIDEILTASHHDAEHGSGLGLEAMGFWESRAKLSAALKDAGSDDELF
jgi:hypothetical protein